MTPLFNLLIAIGGFLIGIVTFFEEIALKIPPLRNLNSLIFKIFFFVIGSLMVTIGVIGKDNESDEKQEKEKEFYIQEMNKVEENYRSEIRKNDSLNSLKIQTSIDSSYAKSIKASNEALAKYNLTFIDSLQSVTSKINIKGSLAQLTIDAVADNTPPIYINAEKNKKFLNIRYISANATSYNIRLNVYIFEESQKGIFLLDHILDPGGYNFLVPDRKRTMSFAIDSSIYRYENALVIILGNYSRDEKGETIIEFKDSYSFNFKDNKILTRRPTIDFTIIKKILEQIGIPYLK